jgi:cell filamentation protein
VKSVATRYEAKGIEAEFEPASRRRVLRNKLGIVRVQDMQEAESEALLAVEDWAVQHFAVTHRFTTKDLRDLHRQWLGDIYSCAGQYRTVNLGKGNFSFAAAAQVPRLMAGFERKELTHHTPCEGMGQNQLISALARTHGEFVLIHPSTPFGRETAAADGCWPY